MENLKPSKRAIPLPYRMLVGDCLERMKEIESGSVDMVCADVAS